MISVTQVLEEFPNKQLVEWMLRDPKKAKQVGDEAKRIGSATDWFIQQEFKPVLPLDQATPLTPIEQEAVKNCLQAWQTFKQQRPDLIAAVTGIQTELTDGEIVGHPDLIVQTPERFGIIDVKTSKAIQPTHWVQVAAYLSLHAPLPVMTSVFLGVLRLDKQTGQPEYRELFDPLELARLAEVWRAYRTLAQHQEQHRELMRGMREQEALDVS